MRDVTVRVVHDASLAAWFGGSLMGVIGLNGAAAQVRDETDRARVAAIGWSRWQPVNTVAAGAHVLAGIGITRANRGRIVSQKGVATVATSKAALTGLALAAHAYAAWLGNQVGDAGDAPVEGATEPAPETPESAAGPQQRLRVVQWTVPVLTGALVVLNAVMGEHQRPVPVARGVLDRLTPDR
ncbi:hypothetical protein [Iamia sp.]|uniref:hypothetical protein n=1 Tax=Iamia sp. TaxID=2722710 RepID=UPI0032C245D4